MFETELMQEQSVDEMVDAYNEAQRMVKEGYRLLGEASEKMTAAFGKTGYAVDFTTIDYYHRSNAEEIARKLKCNAWRCIIEVMGLRKIISKKRQEEIDRATDWQADRNERYKFGSFNERDPKQDMPDLTHAAVLDFIASVSQNAGDMAKEAIKEVYEGLRVAAHSEWSRKLKTNDKNARYDIGNKIILTGICRDYYAGVAPVRVNYGNQERFLVQVERVFMLLDGAGVPGGNVCKLVDAINTSPTGKGETDYFKFQGCHNGNLHLWFKRMDLVKKLNQVGAGVNTQLKGVYVQGRAV